MGKPFSWLEAKFMAKLADAMLPPERVIPVDRIVANIQAQFGMMRERPLQVRFGLLMLFVVLWGPVFLLASREWRIRRIETRLRTSTNNFNQDLGRLRGVIYAGYYGHWVGDCEKDNFRGRNPVLESIGYELPNERERGKSDVQFTQNRRRELEDGHFATADTLDDSYDVIVLGSGAGGAVAAAALARHGHRVLIVEAGPRMLLDDITHEERRMTAGLFIEGALQSTQDRDIILFQGQCVGGSTMINNGICLRVEDRPGSPDDLVHDMAEDVFEAWANAGAPVDRAAFHDSYDAVIRGMEIERIAERSGRANGPHLLRGWDGYRAADPDPRNIAAPATWFSKNYGPPRGDTECAYCGYCNTGCPYGRKNGTAQSFLRMACNERAPARILADARATRIVWKRERQGGKRVAAGVQVKLRDGRKLGIAASKGVVVACGTIASSNLLKASGVRRTGRGISLNIASPVVALMPKGEVRAWDEDQMTTYVDRGDFLLESHFQPPMSMATLVPGWFGDHFQRMRDYNRLASAGILFPADRRGKLVWSPLNLSLTRKLSFKLQPDDMDLLRRALAVLIEVHFEAGASEVYPPLARGEKLERCGRDKIVAFLAEAVREPDDVVLSSSHAHGGNPMNVDPAEGVVDLDCRVHGTANVLVTDASVFPSCIRVNAQLTTMAMAHYATARADPFAASKPAAAPAAAPEPILQTA